MIFIKWKFNKKNVCQPQKFYAYFKNIYSKKYAFKIIDNTDEHDLEQITSFIISIFL